jgi:hypothetical protein
VQEGAPAGYQRSSHSSQEATRDSNNNGCYMDADWRIQMDYAAELSESEARADSNHGVPQDHAPGASQDLQ